MAKNPRQPDRKPISANQLIFFRYQMKLIFSIPIAATPAAEPMISIDPPVPAEKAIKCYSLASMASVYIPIDAATKGTLSMIAERTPRSITTIS